MPVCLHRLQQFPWLPRYRTSLDDHQQKNWQHWNLIQPQGRTLHQTQEKWVEPEIILSHETNQIQTDAHHFFLSNVDARLKIKVSMFM